MTLCKQASADYTEIHFGITTDLSLIIKYELVIAKLTCYYCEEGLLLKHHGARIVKITQINTFDMSDIDDK